MLGRAVGILSVFIGIQLATSNHSPPPALFVPTQQTLAGFHNVHPQDVRVDSVNVLPLLNELKGPSRWRHGYFRQQSLLCAFNNSNAHLYALKDFKTELAKRIFGFGTENEEIRDAAAFHRDDGFARVALLTQQAEGIAQLMEFRVEDDVSELFKISLKGHAKSVRHVCGLQGCAYAILFDSSNRQPSVEYREFSREHISVMEFHVGGAIALESVRLQAQRHIIVASSASVFIYRTDHFLTSAKLISVIPFPNIRSMKAFRSGSSAFLAITSNVMQQSLLELRHDGGLKQVSRITVPQSTHFLPIYPASHGTHILAITTESRDTPLRLFSFSGITHELYEIPLQRFNSFVVLDNSISAFSPSQQRVVLPFFDVRSLKSAFVDIHYILPAQHSPFESMRQRATQRIELAKRKLAHQRNILKAAQDIMSNGARKEATIHRIRRDAKFGQIEVQGRVHTTLKPDDKIGVVDSNIIVTSDKSAVEEITGKLMIIQQQINKANDILRDAVLKSSPQHIRGPKTIVGTVRGLSIQSQRSNILKFGSEPAALINSLYFVDEPKPLKGKLIFKGGLSSPSVNAERMNALRIPQDIVLSDGNWQLFGVYNFTKGLSLNMNSLVHGHLGPIKDTSQIMKISNSATLAAPRKNFQSVVVNKRIEAGTLNMHSIDELKRSFLDANTDQVVRTPIIVEGNVKMSLLNVDSANGLPLSKPLNRFVYRDMPAVISGKKHFKSAVFKKGFQVRHSLNHLRIPEDLMLRHAEQKVTASKTFAAGITASAIKQQQQATLNGFAYPQEIVPISQPGRVLGLVEFSEGAAFNSLQSDGPVDHLLVDEFVHQRNSSRASRPIIFHGPVTAHHLEVSGLFDGENVHKLWRDIITPKESKVEIGGQKTFLGDLAVGEAVVPLVNGFNLHEDFATFGTPDSGKRQLLRGKKIIIGSFQTKHLNSAGGVIDGVNVRAALTQRVTLHTPQLISKTLVINELKTNNLIVEGSLNGTNFPSDFLTTNTAQMLPGLLNFKQLVIRSKIQRKDEHVISPYIAGLSEANQRRIPLNSNFELENVSLDGVDSEHIDASVVDGVNFRKFASRVLRNDENGPVSLSGSNRFEQALFREPVSTPLLNGFDLARLNTVAVSTIKATTIRVPISFQDRVLLEAPLTTSTINSDKSNILNNIATRRDIRFFAPVRFQNKVRSDAPVDVQTVNAAHLARDFLTRHTAQTINTKLNFGGSLHIRGSLEGSPTVNRINLKQLQSSMAHVSPRGQVMMNSPLIFEGPVRLEGDVHTVMVNGENLQRLVANAPCMADGVLDKLIVHGPVEFTQGAAVHNYNKRYDLIKTMADMVFDDGKQYELSEAAFENLKIEGTLECQDFKHEGHLNGLPLEKVLSSAIPVSTNHSIRIPGSLVLNAPTVITDGLEVGSVNNVKFPSDVILRCEHNCPSQTLRDVTIDKLVVPRINAENSDHPSYDLWNNIRENKLISRDRLLEQVFKGKKAINELVIDGDLETHTVNNAQLTQRLARTDGLAVLESPTMAAVSVQSLSLNHLETTNCSSGGLACTIASLKQRGCFDWQSQLPKFHTVILEKGAQTDEINDHDLRPMTQKKQAALNSLQLHLNSARNLVESTEHINEHLINC